MGKNVGYKLGTKMYSCTSISPRGEKRMEGSSSKVSWKGPLFQMEEPRFKPLQLWHFQALRGGKEGKGIEQRQRHRPFGPNVAMAM